MFWHSSPQVNFIDFFSSRIMSLVLSASRGKNRDIVLSLPISCCISFTLLRLYISMLALHFFGLAFISLYLNMKSKNLPSSTPKTHFSRFSRKLNLLRAIKISAKFVECCVLGLGILLSYHLCILLHFYISSG